MEDSARRQRGRIHSDVLSSKQAMLGAHRVPGRPVTGQSSLWFPSAALLSACRGVRWGAPSGGLPRGGALRAPPAVDTPQPGVGGASVTPARRAVAGGLRRGLPAPGRQGFTCSASPRQRSDGRLFAGPVPAPGVGDAATQPEVHAADSLQTVHCFHLKRLKDFSKHCWGVCVRSQFVHGVMFKGCS